jgi:hypothetical protein
MTGMAAPQRLPINYNPPILMTKDLALSLLKAGTNGDQMLQILDSIVLGDSVDESDEFGADATLDAIAF